MSAICDDFERSLRFVEPRAAAMRDMEAMIEKYNFNKVPALGRQFKKQSKPGKERVVLTGTTGALGTYLIALLLQNDSVEKIWALNRGSSGLMERQRASFEDKKLDTELLKDKRLVLLKGNLVDEKLGLDMEDLDDIRETATIFIHNAWPVNFNMRLHAFEPNIKGTYNLLDVAASSNAPTGPPRFMFTSSYTVGGSVKIAARLLETPLATEVVADAMGYGQSKFVVEKILESARASGLVTCIIRLGQLTGDNISGSWSPDHWFPRMVATSLSTGCLPDVIGSVSWLPLISAAQSIIDVCMVLPSDLPAVIHVSHPQPIEWAQISSWVAEALWTRGGNGRQLPKLRFKEWAQQTKRMVSAHGLSEVEKYKHFPFTRIGGMMEDFADGDEWMRSQLTSIGVEPFTLKHLDISQGRRWCPSLRNVPQLGQSHVIMWMRYWERKGLFSNALVPKASL
ncbi:acetyl-CoA synthetase-like protein [Ceratobasidium sp. AG-Ba]|nr:acetyl-CoA synthetase-like protein [Ceratobasidium sp. AG-Ba]QRW13765.1 acetyl-CoA synthetase-like protein [Ceratobasidium sp. AG-Ba]